jgi:hypothetical protein
MRVRSRIEIDDEPLLSAYHLLWVPR